MLRDTSTSMQNFDDNWLQELFEKGTQGKYSGLQDDWGSDWNTPMGSVLNGGLAPLL